MVSSSMQLAMLAQSGQPVKLSEWDYEKISLPVPLTMLFQIKGVQEIQ